MSDSKLSDNSISALMATSRVLVVDDNAVTRELLTATLHKYGIRDVLCAFDGQDAIQKTESFAPDLVLLDIAMPTMDGIEYCQRIRGGESRFRNVPIIVQTAAEDPSVRVRALRMGASDLVVKPVHADELMTRIQLHLDRQRLIDKLTEYRRQMTADLDLARQMQGLLLPSERLLTECGLRYGLAVDSYFRPSQTVGGDYWGIQPISSKILAVYMADFSGHGVSAAINTFRLHAFLPDVLLHHTSAPAMLEMLNDTLCGILSPGQFATFFLGLIDTEKNMLHYAGAGAPPAIMVQEGRVISLDCSGMPLGAFANSAYMNRSVSFGPDAMLLVYSDALTDKNAAGSVPFQPQALVQCVQGWSRGGAKAVSDGLRKRLEECEHQIEDDATFMLITRKTR